MDDAVDRWIQRAVVAAMVMLAIALVTAAVTLYRPPAPASVQGQLFQK
jgi:hypothetical protein